MLCFIFPIQTIQHKILWRWLNFHIFIPPVLRVQGERNPIFSGKLSICATLMWSKWEFLWWEKFFTYIEQYIEFMHDAMGKREIFTTHFPCLLLFSLLFHIIHTYPMYTSRRDELRCLKKLFWCFQCFQLYIIFCLMFFLLFRSFLNTSRNLIRVIFFRVFVVFLFFCVSPK